ncbi:MAG TPA: sigma-70 family RNA polymerase sigma factor, partial [Acidimicrobiales bacterium]|nr:sigma-70 family RNA polymerase sigma factor [Acidimicrobiales bacterium]
MTRGLVEAAREGDPSAWAELVRGTQDLAVAVAVGRLSNWDEARDAAQEAFALAFVHLPELRDPEAFAGWLAALVRTACSRRTRGRRGLAASGLDLVEVADLGQPDPGSLVAGRDERQQVRAAVEALPESLRSVVALHYLAQLSYAEIGEFLGIGTSAAKKRAWTARRHLKELLPMAATALRDARPSRSRHFSDTILLFAAIRRSDLATVRRLIAKDPQLLEAREDWTIAEALDAGLGYAGKATPLIRAAQTGDLAMVRTLVEAGAVVNSPCSCAGAETALWTATAAAAPEVVAYLLDAGADPNAAAFAGATPLHVASQRHHDGITGLLLAHGADPTLVDNYGRTPLDWAARPLPGPARGGAERMLPTGVRAIDLWAPLRRGGLQYWPPAYGLGQFVLLFEIARALPARCWIVGFAHGPYDRDGIAQDIRETDVDATVALTPAGGDATARRADFAAALDRLRQEHGPKFVICLQAPGHT